MTLDELRAVAAYGVACAEPALVIFEKACPDDARPREALAAARRFVDSEPRTRLQRTAAVAANRAAAEAPSEAAQHAAYAAAAASAAAYLHPLATASQLGHILGAAAHAARAAELVRGDDPVVAEYVLLAAAERATPAVLEVLRRYPRPILDRNRVQRLLVRLDSLLRDPPPPARVVADPGPFFHGTKADVNPGELLTPGWQTNDGSGRLSRHIYLTATEWGAPLAAALAQGDGPPRVYRVEPLGTIEDDPNVTDKKFPGNPTRSYRTTGPLRVVAEVRGWEPPDPAVIARMRRGVAELKELGIQALD